MVSSALHLQYRVNCSALEVILSGFYDSIGLYNQPSRKEIDVAKEWLDILHMRHYEKNVFQTVGIRSATFAVDRTRYSEAANTTHFG